MFQRVDFYQTFAVGYLAGSTFQLAEITNAKIAKNLKHNNKIQKNEKVI